MRPGRCGNDPRTQLTPGDQIEVDRFMAYLKERTVKPKVVCICGSMRFAALMQEHAEMESLLGNIVVMPHVNMKAWDGRLSAENEGAVKTRLDELHRAKIRMATGGILVVGDYVGESTTAEIRYARWLGLPVRFTHPEVDPGDERR